MIRGVKERQLLNRKKSRMGIGGGSFVLLLLSIIWTSSAFSVLRFQAAQKLPVIHLDRQRLAGVSTRCFQRRRFRGPALSSLQQPYKSSSLFGKIKDGDNDLVNRNNDTAIVAKHRLKEILLLDLDRIRRRQLVVSMLSIASLSPALRRAMAAAEGGEKFNETVPVASSTKAGPLDIIKAPLDDREYLTITLENGLRVLLCSDPSTTEAAAAMDVHVGATSDPPQVPGLAHFTEHMLFMGTKQYPQENSFEAFLSNNGGSSNAYTDAEDTVYYFDMQTETNSKLLEGLRRFGSFFSDPLFSASATGRELNAIESENKKNLQTDSFRLFQIAKSRANLDHPFSKFFTGNRYTLLENTVAQGVDLRDELIQFYNKHYSANQMTLAVVAPLPLPELKQMAIDAFSSIPNKNVLKPELDWQGVAPFAVTQKSIVPAFGSIVEVVPVQDLRQLILSWPIRFNSDQDRQNAKLYKTSLYVAHLLGHEGPRSLLSYFKRQGWANSVSAGSQEDLSDFATFDFVIGLTPRGLEFINEIIEAVYSYITMIKEKQVPQYVVNEVFQLEELQWRFLSKSNPRSYVTSLATSMQKYPPEYYVAGPRRLGLDGYYSQGEIVDPAPRTAFSSKDQLDRTVAQITSFAQQLNPGNGLVTVLSKTFETDRREKWYGTDFSVRTIPSSVSARWERPVSSRKLQIDFPRANPFIPSEEGLRVKNQPLFKASERTFETRMKPIRAPRIIQDDGSDGRWTVYFKEDDRFGIPKAFVVLELVTQDVFASAKNAALANLYELCVTDRLGEYAYDAELAGLNYEVKVVPRGVRLTFAGYSDKLKVFASYIAKKLSRDVDQLLPRTGEEFERYKDQVMRALSGFDVKQPYFHASYYSQLVLHPRNFQYSNSDLRKETRSILLRDLIGYSEAVWKNGKAEALIQGNLEEQEAISLVKALGDALPFRSVPANLLPPRLEALPLPSSQADMVPTRLLVGEPNLADENSVSYIMLQSLKKSEKDHVLIELISSIVSEPFYNELRTQKQLGYIVSSGLRGLAGTRTLSFVVQSSVAPSAKLTVEIINFLDSVESNLIEKLALGDLSVYVRSLIDRKTEPDKELSVEVTRNWNEIASGRLQFDRLVNEAAALLEVGKEDLLEYWRNLYSRDGRRMLITEIIPHRGEAASPQPPPSSGYEPGDLFTPGLVLGIDDVPLFRFDSEKYFDLLSAETLLSPEVQYAAGA